MRIKKLYIKEFKNLKDFEVDFDTQSPYTVLVGRNGTGKSNLLEALTLIFKNLDLDKKPEFAFEVTYLLNNNKDSNKIIEISIDADPSRSTKRYKFKVDGKPFTKGDFYGKNKRFLPRFLLGYYSGPSNRLEKHFDEHQNNFYNKLIKEESRLSELPLRPFLYARKVHANFALLAFFLKEEKGVKQFLEDNLGIVGIESVLFSMREPISWKWQDRKGDERFWNAEGAIRQLLSKLYSLALAPLKKKKKVKLNFRQTPKKEHLFLFLKDVNKLKQLAKDYKTQQDFFKALESAYISELLGEVSIKVKIKNMKGKLSFRELSEGEQQLLMVLGLLKFTMEDESLFLLDEPDTHLNAAWSIQYMRFIEQVLGDLNNCQLLICTHDPLVISGLTKSQVQIMKCKEGKKEGVYAEAPEQDPKGMGVAGLLTSEIYGLKSQLDLDTQALIDERTCLLAKAAKRTQKDNARMRDITQHLSKLGFMTSFKDPFYEVYAKAISSRPEFQKPVLTKADIEEQDEIANEIMSELLSGKSTSKPKTVLKRKAAKPKLVARRVKTKRATKKK